MTRKHFTAIASIMRQHGADAGVVADMANYFASCNARFDAARFMEAAGITDGYRIGGGHFGPATVTVTGPAFEVVGSYSHPADDYEVDGENEF